MLGNVKNFSQTHSLTWDYHPCCFCIHRTKYILKKMPHIYNIIRKREYKEAIRKSGLRTKYFIDTRAWRSNCFLLSLAESCKRLFSRRTPHTFSSSYPSRFLLAQSQLSFPLNKAHPRVIVSVVIPMVFWRSLIPRITR